MIGNKEREQNDLAEGPRSRTEQNDFKKSERAPRSIYNYKAIIRAAS